VERVQVNDELVGYLYRPETANGRSVLFVHGWRTQQSKYAFLGEALVAKGYMVLTVDLRGHGESKGDWRVNSRKDHMEDVLAGYDYLWSVAEKNDISVMGCSYGGYFAAILSAEREVRSVILWVAATYPDVDWEVAKPEINYKKTEYATEEVYRNTALPKNENRAFRALVAYEGPVLVIRAELDEYIPDEMTKGFVQCREGIDQVMMRGAKHSLSGDEERKEQLVEIVAGWLRRN